MHGEQGALALRRGAADNPIRNPQRGPVGCGVAASFAASTMGGIGGL